jgi:hypothetical protein
MAGNRRRQFRREPPVSGRRRRSGGGRARLLFLSGATAAAFILAALPGRPAMAQEIPRGETVKSRPKPELDPTGIRMGGLFLYPKVSVSESFDDNIMSTKNNEKSDYITVSGANAALESDWSRHYVKLAGDAKVGRYWNSSAEDYKDYSFLADGRYDISKNFSVAGGTDVLFGHEDRSSLDGANGIRPTQFSKISIDGSVKKAFNKVSINSGFVIDRFKYDNVASLTGTINNHDRNRLESMANLRLGYSFSPDYESFVRLKVNNRNYKDRVDDNGYNRDSNGYELTTGIFFGGTGITFGNVFAGYRKQSFKDPNLTTAEGVSGGLDITWNATSLTTVKGGIVRTVEETTTIGASGIFRTKFTLSVDHELLRNMIISAKLASTRNDYAGIKRTDNDFAFDFDVDYKLFRNLYSNFSYGYSQRKSDVSNVDYGKNVYMIRLSSQL